LEVGRVVDLRRPSQLAGAPSGDEHGGGVAAGDQVGEERELLRLERGDGVVAGDNLPH
jgi:hypothetical protein